MDNRFGESGLRGIALVLFGLQLTITDIALFPDGGTLLAFGAALIGLLGVIYTFRPLI